MSADREADRAQSESVALETAESSVLGSRTLLGAALLGSTATLIVGVLGVLRTKVVAVELDPSGVGLYGQILTLLTAMTAASGLGLGLGTTRVVAECRTRGDREGLKRALEVSVAVPLAISTALGLVLMASAGALAPLLLDEERSLLIVFAALALPLVAMQGPLLHALQGYRDVAGVQGANVTFGVTLTVASIAGAVLFGLDGAVLALALGNLGYAGALAWRFRGHLRSSRITLALRAGLRLKRLKEPVIRGMIAIGFASLFVGLASGLADLAVRTLVLREDGAASAGNFTALQLISVQLFGVIVGSVTFLSFTSITEAHAAGDRAGVRRVLDDSARLALLLALPVIVALGLFREEVVRLFLSSDFGPAADLLPRQLAGDVLRTIAYVLGAALVPAGLTRLWVWIAVLTVLGYLGTAAALVPPFGLEGAVNAYMIEWGVAAVLTVAVLLRRGLLAPSAMTLRTVGAGVVAAAIVAAPEPAVPVAALVSVAFACAVLLLCTGREERLALWNRVRGLLRR